MPTCIFILSRFTLRVDGVLFRTFDTRIYSSLENDEGTIVIRETTGWEAPYDVVKNVGRFFHAAFYSDISLVSSASQSETT